jgi:hypothetical protein
MNSHSMNISNMSQMAVEELRNKYFEKNGDIWKSSWTRKPVGGSIEHESSTVPGRVGGF